MKLSTPEDAGMSSERLARIQPVMDNFVKDNRMPGMLTLLKRRGKIVHYGSFGAMDIGANRAMQEDALFRIYSMTKPITSVALMMLYEEGRIGMTDPVSKYIPAFGKTKVYSGEGVPAMKLVEQEPAMSLYHLITHTAGLSYGWGFDSPVEALYRETLPKIFHRDQTLKEGVERLAELPLLYQPGTKWRYSLAMDVMGRVVEVVSGMPYADFLAERIFKPLGMTDTFFTVPADKVNRLAKVYHVPKNLPPIAIPDSEVGFIYDVTKPTQCALGGGGLVSSLADYLAFSDCLLNNTKYDGGRLLSRKTLEWMTASHVPESWLPLSINGGPLDHAYGMGFRVATDLGQARNLTSVGEFGWGGAASTYFWVDPAEEFIGVFMTQIFSEEDYPVIDRFQALAYQAIDD